MATPQDCSHGQTQLRFYSFRLSLSVICVRGCGVKPDILFGCRSSADMFLCSSWWGHSLLTSVIISGFHKPLWLLCKTIQIDSFRKHRQTRWDHLFCPIGCLKETSSEAFDLQELLPHCWHTIGRLDNRMNEQVFSIKFLLSARHNYENNLVKTRNVCRHGSHTVLQCTVCAFPIIWCLCVRANHNRQPEERYLTRRWKCSLGSDRRSLQMLRVTELSVVPVLQLEVWILESFLPFRPLSLFLMP